MAAGRAPIPVDAWDSEPELVDESLWTPGGEGWSAWNGMSPEREFCEFVVALVALNRPALIIETGIGQGYLTRRLLAVLPGRYLGYESNEELRGRLRQLDVWSETAELAEQPEPSAEEMAACELAILDSAVGPRARELDLWREQAPAGSFVLVHDARPDHPVEDGVWRRVAEYVGEEGVFLGNPRGSWLYRKPVELSAD